MNEPLESVSLRKDICYVLERVGRSLQESPEYLRPLKLFAERLDNIVGGAEDPDLVFLNSYISLFVEDLYFNLLTDISAWPKPKNRAEAIIKLGIILQDLAGAINGKDEQTIYATYKRLGKIWKRDIPELGKKKRKEAELYPKYSVKLEQITSRRHKT